MCAYSHKWFILVDYCFHNNDALAIANSPQALGVYENQNLLASLLALCSLFSFSCSCYRGSEGSDTDFGRVLFLIIECIHGCVCCPDAIPPGILRGSLTGILVVLGDYKESWSIQLCPKCGIHEVYAIELEMRTGKDWSQFWRASSLAIYLPSPICTYFVAPIVPPYVSCWLCPTSSIDQSSICSLSTPRGG